MRRLIDFIRDALDFFRPVDFGEHGILVRDETGNLVPMDDAFMERMKAETHEAIEAIEDFWFQKEAEAFETHGEAILRPQ